MRPTGDTTLSRPDLGQVVWEVQQESLLMGFIGLAVMPIFPVAEFSATYPVIPKEALFNIHDVRRNAKGGYNRIIEEFEEGFYKTSDNGLEYPIDDRQAAIYSSKFNYEASIARILMNAILREHEKRVKDKVINTATFTPHNAAHAWSSHGDADPVYDVDEGRDSLRKKGVEANTLVVPYEGLKNLRQMDAVKERVYQIFPDAAKTGRISIEHIRSILDVEKFLVAGALYNSAKKGKNASLADIWGTRYAMLCRTSSPDADITDPSIGRTFLWNEGQNGDMPIVEQYREESTRGDVLRVRHDSAASFLTSYDEDGSAKSEISKSCGYLLDMTAAS